MKATLLTPEIAETVLEEKAEKTTKSQMYYNRTAKDLSVLQPGDTVPIKPEGLTKRQLCMSHRATGFLVFCFGFDCQTQKLFRNGQTLGKAF